MLRNFLVHDKYITIFSQTQQKREIPILYLASFAKLWQDILKLIK